MKAFAGGVIIVPWDFSEYSRCALDFVVDNIASPKIHVICILEAPNPYAPDFVLPFEAEENAIRACERQFAREVHPEQHRQLQFHAVFGEPAREIVRIARQYDASLIALSTHGRGGVHRLVTGSVTEAVLRLASCPVLVLPKTVVAASRSGDSDPDHRQQVRNL